jgi:hypothetical protein
MFKRDGTTCARSRCPGISPHATLDPSSDSPDQNIVFDILNCALQFIDEDTSVVERSKLIKQ